MVVVGEGTGGAAPARPLSRRGFSRLAPEPAEVELFHHGLAGLPGATVRRVDYPGLGHGATLGASLPHALRLAAGIDE